MMRGAQHARSRLRRCTASAARIGLFLVSLDFLLFLLFDLLPEAAIQQAGIMAVDPAFLEATRDRLGVTGPWYERFALFWWQLLHGDLGVSLHGGYPISELIGDRWFVTFVLLLTTLFILLTVPVPLASLRARSGLGGNHSKGWLRGAPISLALIPQFLLAVALFAIWTGFLADLLHRVALEEVGRWAFAVLSVAAMPAAIAFLSARATIEAALREPFTATYRMLGMTEPQIRDRLSRNAWLSLRPLMARLALICTTGVIFAELIFELPGVGQLFVRALQSSDLNLMRILVLCLAAVVLVTTEVERRVA